MTDDTKPHVLLIGEFEHTASQSFLTSLLPLMHLHHLPTTTPDSFRTLLNSPAPSIPLSKITHLYRTFYSFSQTGPLTPSDLSHFPSLRRIILGAAGYDSIPIPYCLEHGIQVSNTPDVTESATADTALYLILSALRGFNRSERILRSGGWLRDCPLGHEPRGKTIGVLGLGGIGREVVKRVKPLGVGRVIYHNRRRVDAAVEKELGVEYVTFEELLKEADVLTIHVPLSEATYHVVGEKEIAMMKQGAVVVNTARGGVVDDEALVKALEEGRVAAAGFDVLEGEPEVRWGLAEREDVVLLPHVGTHTVETRTEMDLRGLRNLRAVLEGGEVEDLVVELEGLKGKGRK
ncbi:glyoxylate reductase [Ascodesmis nigricans]|uniref:Glyoxylate reductase n=1 Tax=Ascodesmis nigricans TaxID=341454 RepID=A0A4S2MRH0_9PEZI|nr:glyoxylate reductase [Ascodesmis nigricans]